MKMNNYINHIINGNCIDVIKKFNSNSINLIYLDPPFFTQRTHSLTSRKENIQYSFDDKYETLEKYLSLIEQTLNECKRVLSDNGSIFVHCDKIASHHLRIIAEKVFGANNFQSEIIWSYKRWSNSKKGLLNSHQTIFFFSKSNEFKFNTIFGEYSETTNIDQILQERVRDNNGKTIYKKGVDGNIVTTTAKKGVPLSDIWEIPFLNPKAKERVGYPTQKPVALLERIISIASDENDTILDPFCGSGTTCVAAKHLNRNFIGIDISTEAVNLTLNRLDEMIITNSKLLAVGKKAYIEKSEYELQLLNIIGAIPVQRNKQIDGFLKEDLIPIRIQKHNESIEDSTELLNKYIISKKSKYGILIQTNNITNAPIFAKEIANIKIIKDFKLQLLNQLIKFKHSTITDNRNSILYLDF